MNHDRKRFSVVAEWFYPWCFVKNLHLSRIRVFKKNLTNRLPVNVLLFHHGFQGQSTIFSHSFTNGFSSSPDLSSWRPSNTWIALKCIMSLWESCQPFKDEPTSWTCISVNSFNHVVCFCSSFPEFETELNLQSNLSQTHTNTHTQVTLGAPADELIELKLLSQ